MSNKENSSPTIGGDDLPTTSPTPVLKLIETEKIRLQPDRPRRASDDDDIIALAASIEEVGLLTPIGVMQHDPDVEDYELRTGERRYRACLLLGVATIPALVFSGKDNAGTGLIENLQRQDLPALDESNWLADFKARYDLTDERLAKMTGRSRSAITQMLGIAKLGQHVQEQIRAMVEAPPRDHLIQLSQCENDEQQLALLQAIQSGTTQAKLRETRKALLSDDQQPADRMVKAMKREVGRVLKLEADLEQLRKHWTPSKDEVAEIRRVIALFRAVINSAPNRDQRRVRSGATNSAPTAH